VAIKSGVIRLGIEAPPGVSILRGELLPGAASACIPPGGHNGRKRRIRGTSPGEKWEPWVPPIPGWPWGHASPGRRARAHVPSSPNRRRA